MKITFLGATHEVTGSCFYLEACGKHILIDCGLEQGQDVYENQDIPVPISEIDTVLLTHAHMDHAGKLPLLYANGFRGNIHSTGATAALCRIMLQDSAHIQMSEAEWKNRKARRKGEALHIPLYNLEDALGAINSFVSYDYNEKHRLYEGIEFRFIDCGHLLGSASIEIWITEGDNKKKVVFSGDIGNINQPLIKDPTYITEADYVIMESTYGDRNHGERPDYVNEIAAVIQSTFDKGGNVVIPSFAVGRTQMLLYFIRKIKEEGLVKGHDGFKVYVDSPLANEATSIFMRNMQGYFDEEAMTLVNQGINPISFPGLRTSVTTDESKAINFEKEPKVIISASGMCDAGRIRHHLKHNLWREESTVLFVGHQTEGSLGNMILNRVPEVRLFGETVSVKANVHKLSGMSGHADKKGLLRWILAFDPKPKKVFVVHGDKDICDIFRDSLIELELDAVAPYSGDVYDLTTGECIKKGEVIEIQTKEYKNKTVLSAYTRLVNAGKRLMTVIKHNEGGANKDLGKFTDQINSLCDKWDR